ncbi:Zinc finger FYVE domain-containing protein 26 [Chionoecetes opilio]|uniref:Zinc finger FYVE domain-containing protein 26 n=1 Tax=Chionoecetes opilio TaxID=41210 RepID=A0A8J4YA78_CHIOP|nr:Zinc finger FYVE domain-containing protein 26 [Chionoecetes opilio]
MSTQAATQLLHHLAQRKKFGLSMEWAKHHHGGAALHRLLDQSCLMEVLDKTTPDFSVASEALEAFNYQDLTVTVQELLQKLSNFSTRKFLMEFYLKKHFNECSSVKSVQTFPGEGGESPENSEDVTAGAACGGGGVDVASMLQEVMGLLLIGVVAPPVLDRYQLSHLVTSPHLIIEQWLMNVRLEAMEKAVRVLRPFLDMVDTHVATTDKPKDLNSSRNTETVVPGLSWVTLNQLLETYGAKALDTTGVQLALKPSATIERASQKFVMPAHPPNVQEWLPDAEVRKCPVCAVTIFSMFSRRHHCRRCGRVVCSTCSQHRSIVQSYGGLFVRVCLDCYNQTKELNLHNYIQIRPLGDGTYDSVSVSTEDQSPHGGTSLASDMEGGWYLSQDEQHNDIIRHEFCFDYAPSLSLCLAILSHHQDDRRAALCVIKLCHHLFALITSSLQLMNPTVDHTFVLSMIQTLLASAKVRFGNTGEHQGIGLCEYYTQWVDLLSLILKSNCGHIMPHEALENMQIIGDLHQKSLLREGEMQLVLDRRLKQEFLYMRRLRDMLVKRQLWGLALDVSTKVGLEANGVWGAWAMASLKAGDFQGARERFSRVLERPSDKNRPCKPSLLSEVIKYLESNPFQVNQQVMEQAQRTRSSIMLTDHNKLSSSQALVVLHSLQNLHKISEGSLTCKDSHKRLSLPTSKHRKTSTTCKMEPIFQAECKYYLTLYGNHAMAIQYFMRHRQMQECVEYIQHASIDLDIFIENALIPILRCGQLTHLMRRLHASDPQLEKWGKLLLGSCRWLERCGWWHCLLSLQETMGDRLRASMTLLRMYTEGARSYTTLSTRTEYVSLALSHLQSYLDQQALTTSSPKRKISILTMSPWQINQNINMLKLQTDVTKFLASCEASGGDAPAYIRALVELKVVKGTGLPTLLTSDGERLGAAILVMCLAEVVADGLTLAYRIVEHTQMAVEKLLSNCCLVLVERGQVKHLGRVVRGVREWQMLTAARMDDTLRPAMLALANTTHAVHLDTLVKLLSNDTARMDMFLQCGRLRSAYLVAVHMGEPAWVERVKATALGVGQNHVPHV